MHKLMPRQNSAALVRAMRFSAWTAFRETGQAHGCADAADARLARASSRRAGASASGTYGDLHQHPSSLQTQAGRAQTKLADELVRRARTSGPPARVP